jgi:hypothetical protein
MMAPNGRETAPPKHGAPRRKPAPTKGWVPHEALHAVTRVNKQLRARVAELEKALLTRGEP